MGLVIAFFVPLFLIYRIDRAEGFVDLPDNFRTERDDEVVAGLERHRVPGCLVRQRRSPCDDVREFRTGIGLDENFIALCTFVGSASHLTRFLRAKWF